MLMIMMIINLENDQHWHQLKYHQLISQYHQLENGWTYQHWWYDIEWWSLTEWMIYETEWMIYIYMWCSWYVPQPGRYMIIWINWVNIWFHDTMNMKYESFEHDIWIIWTWHMNHMNMTYDLMLIIMFKATSRPREWMILWKYESVELMDSEMS